ncbi:MAG TPA: hypothetical protein VNI83_12755 [Vicinamibacterales bacterium]|nr:hypothetical protein [Vicinamibacterales bacterium]
MTPDGFALPAAVDLEFAVAAVFKVTGVPIGLEGAEITSATRAGAQAPAVSLGGRNARDVVQYLLSRYVDSDAREVEGVILIRPREVWEGRRAIVLERLRLSLEIEDAGYDEAVGALVSRLCEGVRLPSPRRPLNLPRVSLVVQNITALEALVLFSKATGSAWIVKPSRPEDRLSLSLIAPGGVTTGVSCRPSR